MVSGLCSVKDAPPVCRAHPMAAEGGNIAEGFPIMSHKEIKNVLNPGIKPHGTGIEGQRNGTKRVVWYDREWDEKKKNLNIKKVLESGLYKIL